MCHPSDRLVHTTAFVKQVVEHWLEQNNASIKSTLDQLVFYF